MVLRLGWIAPGLACLAGSAGCLPEDTRPPPGRVLVTVSPDEALLSGVSTADGWAIDFDRFLVSLGRVSLEGDDCLTYSDPDYSRVLDLGRAGTQKLALAYAVGHCDFDVELSSPHADAVLGEGANQADKTFLRTPADDPFVTASGVSIHAAGRATKGGASKRFAWSYRHRVDYATCSVGGEDMTGIDVVSREETVVDLRIRGRDLFVTRRADPDADVRFQPFADADSLLGDGDGAITLEELSRVLLSDLAVAPAGDAGTGTDASAAVDAQPYAGLDRWTSLLDFLYLGLFPLVVRYDGDGTCAMEVFPNDRERR
jgi:hypothetical protein